MFSGEIHVGLVEDDDAALRAAQRVEAGQFIAASTGGVGRRDEGQSCLEIPLLLYSQLAQKRDGEILLEGHGVRSRPVSLGQDWIKRVTWIEKLDHFAR